MRHITNWRNEKNYCGAARSATDIQHDDAFKMPDAALARAGVCGSCVALFDKAVGTKAAPKSQFPGGR